MKIKLCLLVATALIVTSTLSGCKEEESSTEQSAPTDSSSSPSSSTSSATASNPSSLPGSEHNQPPASSSQRSSSNTPSSPDSSTEQQQQPSSPSDNSQYGARSGNDHNPEAIPDPMAQTGGDTDRHTDSRDSQSEQVNAPTAERNQNAKGTSGGRENKAMERTAADGTGSGTASASGSPAGGGYGSQQIGGGQGELTRAEQIAVLDAQLNESLAVFDGMILSERASAQTRDQGIEDGLYDESAEAGLGEEDGSLFEEGDLQSDEDDYGHASENAGTNNQDGEYQGGDGQRQGQASGVPGGRHIEHDNVPEDIPDGHDDDIVARQIREAAMKETDPGLREKLWAEYRKYKGGSR